MKRGAWTRIGAGACDVPGAWVALLALVVLASPAAAESPDVAIENANGSCRVRGSFSVAVTPEIAWGVLTDYDGITAYVPSVKSSHLEPAADGRLRLRQQTVASVMLMKKRVEVLLALEETPRRRIGFHDELGADFREYAGEWRIEPGPRGTQVTYELGCEPRGALARWFCRGALRGAARDLLEQVRAEMLRRARN